MKRVCRKIRVLLWKEAAYRLKVVTFIPIVVVFIIGFASNIVRRGTLNKIDMSYKPVSISNLGDDTCKVKDKKAIFAYEPSSTVTARIMEEVACQMGYDKNNIKIGFDEAFTYGVKFVTIKENQAEPPESLDYIIFPTEKNMDSHTSALYGFQTAFLPVSTFTSKSLPGIFYLQSAIDRIFLQMRKNPHIETTDAQFVPQNGITPRAKYQFSALSLTFIPFFLYFVENNEFISFAVIEKVTGLREFLKIMGFSKFLIRFTASLASMVVYSISIFIFLVFLYTPFLTESFTYTTVEGWLMAATLFLSALDFLFAGFLFSLFFRNKLLSSMADALIWVVSMGYAGLVEGRIFPNLPRIVQIIFACVPQVWFARIFMFLSRFESSGKKVAFDDNLSPSDNELPIGYYYVIMIVKIFVYFLLGIYLENVLPGQYGRPLPFYYCFTKSFWSRGKKTEDNIPTEDISRTEGNLDAFEEAPKNLVPGITVQNLRKIYGFKTKDSIPALDNVTLNFYEGEITGILGHNGAGKTTLISILCGMILPSSGKIIIEGTEMTLYGRHEAGNIGYCPQTAILLDELSVYKNLIFFAMIIVLDEPSTGIDISTMHEIWQILLEYRGERTMILCTHFMEEADSLCDRIAVFAYGQVKCIGSPMFLKSKFGTGYSLSIVATNTGKVSALTDLVKKFVKGAVLKYQNVLTLVFQLPEKEISAFPDLFEALDDQKKKNEIVSYTVTTSSMEDVFLNIDRALKEEYEAQKGVVQTPTIPDDLPKKPALKGLISLALIMFMENMQRMAERPTNKIVYNLDFYGKPKILYSSNVDTEYIQALEKIKTESGHDFVKVDNVEEEIIKIFKEESSKTFYNHFLAFQFHPPKITVLLNTETIHGPSIAINLLHNAFLKSESGAGFIKTSVELNYLRTEKFSEQNDASESIMCIKTLNFNILGKIMFQFLFIPFFMLALHQERKTNLKIYQLMVVPPVIYWFSHFCIDWPLLFFHSVVSFVLSGATDEVKRHFLINIAGHLILGVIFISACMLLMLYAGMALFKNSFLAFCVPFKFFLLSAMLSQFGSDNIPFLTYLTPFTVYLESVNAACMHNSKISLYLVMVFHLFSWLIILLLLESNVLAMAFHWFMVLLYKPNFNLLYPKDGTVEEEEKMIENMKKNQLSEKILTTDGIKCWYCCSGSGCCKCKTKTAVRGVSFSIPEQECLGLVGANGAGKSSIFKALTGTIVPSKGTAYLRSSSILNCFLRHKTFAHMGYCPQFGSYLPEFKGREMIQLFGRLQGLRGSQLKQEVNKLVRELQLEEHMNKKCKKYSGGTLRKMAVIMALLGNPMIALLDEPTTGIDPAARRSIWNMISHFREAGQCILLTTHSMDECEALCTRLAIMTDGQLRCIGEVTTLKNIFGQNYVVQIKINNRASKDDRTALMNAMNDSFGSGCQIMKSHLTVMQFQIAKESATWKKLFSNMNTIKSKFPILESFSASSVTLEQLFIGFTKD